MSAVGEGMNELEEGEGLSELGEGEGEGLSESVRGRG